jgi:hypothetical protein
MGTGTGEVKKLLGGVGGGLERRHVVEAVAAMPRGALRAVR